jgi:hypothetical protein
MKLLTFWVLTVFIAACLVGTPAFSGEHPWDNDNQHPTTGSTGGSSSGGSGDVTGTDYICKSAPTTGGSSRPGTSSSASASIPIQTDLLMRATNWLVSQFYGGGSVLVQSKQNVQTRRQK